MSNGINPNDPNRLNAAQFNNKKKGNTPEANTESNAPVNPAPADRQTVDADKILGLLGQMGAQNLSQVENVAMDKSMAAFSNMISPEAHAKLYSTFESSFKEEFGFQPSPHLVQEAVDNYLIGPDGTGKLVLRRSLRGLVPDPILERRDKIGFATPEGSWLRTLTPWVEEVLASDSGRANGLLRLPVVRKRWQEMSDGTRPFDPVAWRWLNLIRWADRLDVQID